MNILTLNYKLWCILYTMTILFCFLVSWLIILEQYLSSGVIEVVTLQKNIKIRHDNG